MEKYLGVRIVEAEPMIFAGAVNHGYYKSKAHFDILAKGYHVRYHDGTDKWVPKAIFEREYFQISSTDDITEDDCMRFYKRSRYTLPESISIPIYAGLKFVLRWARKGFDFS